MKINNILIFLGLILFIINYNTIFSQPLDSLINEGMKNNPMIKSLQKNVISLEHRANSYNALPPPTLSFEISQVPFNTLNWLDQPYSQNLSFSQMFPIGGKIDAMVNTEKSNIKIEEQNVEFYKLNLKANIKMLYYSIWLIDRKITIQDETIALLNDLLKSLNTLYEVNKVSQADIYSLKSEVSLNQTQIVILKNQLEIEKSKLNKLLGRNINSQELQIQKDLQLTPLNFSEIELDSMLIANNPNLRKMQAMINMNQLEIISNSKEKVPDLMLQGMVMRMPGGMVITTKTPPDMITGNGKTEFGYSLMASVTLPFAPWSKGKFEEKEEELNIKTLSIQEELNDMRRDMLSQLRTAFLKMQTSQELITLYSENLLPIYEQSRLSQTSAYQVNQTNINSVIDASRMLLMQKMNLLMAQADYQMAFAEIEMMVGKSLN